MKAVIQRVSHASVEVSGQVVGRIETGLIKLSRGTGWRVIINAGGQRATTDYRILGAANRTAAFSKH